MAAQAIMRSLGLLGTAHEFWFANAWRLAMSKVAGMGRWQC